MREIPLTQGQVAIVDDSDYETLSQWKWHAYWNKYTQSYYAKRNVPTTEGKHRQKTLRMHTFIMGGKADHKNHDTLDNRRSNLRLATGTQNAANRRIQQHNTSGYKGVSWHKRIKRWHAYIKYEQRPKHLGYFDDPIDAAKAYDAAARELFGEFAYLNFPETKK